jgi:ubiquinone/menaquinone biosynthesis C-methylase UbiE
MSMGGETAEGGVYGRFDRISAVYDAARREFPSETVAYVIRHLAGKKPFVLDLACGTGISTRQLAAGGIEVVGCDVDPHMVRYAAGRAGVGNRFVIEKAEAIPFKDASFDAVACFRAYHWFDPARAVPEMMRVLRPDGRIAIANMTGATASTKTSAGWWRSLSTARCPITARHTIPSAICGRTGCASSTSLANASSRPRPSPIFPRSSSR